MNIASSSVEPRTSNHRQHVDDVVCMVRYLESRSRRVIRGSILLAFVGLGILFLASFLLESTVMRPMMAITVALTQLPLLLISLSLFDFASTRLDARGSMLDGFVKRSPISTWAIAGVTWSSKAVGIFIWMIFLMASMAIANELMPTRKVVELFLTFLGIAFWFSVIVWRPFRWEIGRVALGLSVLLLGYLTFAAVAGIIVIDQGFRILGFAWPPWIGVISGLLFGWRSIRASRGELTAQVDLISDAGKSQTPKSSRLIPRFLTHPRRPEHLVASKGTVGELLSFDRRRIVGISSWITIGLSPFLLMLLLDAPLIGALLSAVFGHFIAGLATSGGWGDVRSGRLVSGKRRTLDLIAVSPISLTTLCRIKIQRCVFVGVCIASALGIACIASTYLSGSIDRWRSWAVGIATVEETFPVTGLRVCVATWLLALLSIVGTTVGNVWFQFFAKDRWVATVTIALQFCLAIGVGVGLYRLITMDNYDSMIAFRDRLYASVPWLVLGMVLVKASIFPFALRSAFRRKAPDRRRWVLQVLSTWSFCIFSAFLIVWSIWPSLQPPPNSALTWLYQPTGFQLLLLVILLVPCSRVLTMPWALATDIHR